MIGYDDAVIGLMRLRPTGLCITGGGASAAGDVRLHLVSRTN